MNVLGSWEPVTFDAYYEAKKKSGLIGRPEDYMSGQEITEEDLDAMIVAKLAVAHV